MIVAHHGLGEEIVLYALTGGGAAVPAAALLWRARLSALTRWLLRR